MHPLLQPLVAALNRLGQHRWALAIRHGFLLTMPLVMVGAFAVALGNLPFLTESGGAAYQTFRAFCARVDQASFGIIALGITITVSYALASLRLGGRYSEVSPAVASIVALMCFLAMVMPADGQLTMAHFGRASVFPALVAAILATELFLRLLRVPQLRLLRAFNDANPALPGLLQSILPALITITLFFLAPRLLGLQDGNLASTVSRAIDALFLPLDSSLARAMLFNLLNHLFWFFGIHGNHVLLNVQQRYFESATTANAAAVAAGQTPTEVFAQPFFDVYVFMGGSGVVMALIIAVLLCGRRSNEHKIARLALGPAVFNVSEIMVFGLPVVLNPIFILPFVIAPLVLVLTAWLATVSGFVPPIHAAQHWTTPPLISGYLATGSWRGVLMQAINLAIAVAIYLPFVRHALQQKEALRKQGLESLLDELHDLTTRNGGNVLNRQDAVGSLARQLASDLAPAQGQGALRLVYQPEVDAEGRVIGMEALLRWQHPLFGDIPPQITVPVAEQSGLMPRLGEWVVDEACRQLMQWQLEGVHDLRISLNMSPNQLRDPGFCEHLRLTMQHYHLRPEHVALEITGVNDLTQNDPAFATMNTVAKGGVTLTIDDFGMEYPALRVLNQLAIHSIKLDRTLTREAQHDPACGEIIESITSVCRGKDVRILAKGIETDTQFAQLRKFGCHAFQGHLFSVPLEESDCLAWLKQHKPTAA